MINNYRAATAYLNSFVNYERRSFFPYQKSLKLKRVYLLLRSLGVPYPDLKAIHIAGTKGKGSSACFCAAALAAGGYKTGLYTSPHLYDFRERIKIVISHKSSVISKLISRKDVVRIVEEFRKKLKKSKLPEELGEVSFFEIYTALAFKYFLKKKVDVAVLETGLGGRLDATNVVKPLVSLITHIGYDHTDKLGKSLAAIAAEKAGIIKRRIPVVCAPQEESVRKVIASRCRERQAPLFMFGRDFKTRNIRLKKEYTLFDFEFAGRTFKNLKIYLRGEKQVENAALSLAAGCLLKDKLADKGGFKFKSGLKSAILAARFETVSKNPLIVADIAHNVSSAAALNANLKTYFPSRKAIVVFAAAKDKDVRKMLAEIDFAGLILTRFGNPRSFTPEELRRISGIKKACTAGSVKAALKKALELYASDCIIVITGSLFLVSEAKRLIGDRPQLTGSVPNY